MSGHMVLGRCRCWEGVVVGKVSVLGRCRMVLVKCQMVSVKCQMVSGRCRMVLGRC